MEKKKILFISDHPLIPSGVGTQSRYLIEGLLKTGKYKFTCLGGAISHPDYRPQKVFPELYGDDWHIHPINGYGDRELLRKFLLNEKPDLLLIVTDPRFYMWLFEMEDEVRKVCPIAYWHVWDNDPSPEYNDASYAAIDGMVALSLKTYGLLQDLTRLGAFNRNFFYVPHAIPPDTFKPLPEPEIQKFKATRTGPHANKKFFVFWNNRNARRKMTGDVIATFAQFAQKVGKENVALFMQTQPKDPEGQDIYAVARKFNIDTNMIISENRVSPEDMNIFYNICDTTINIANNEGFGLSTLETLMCGNPIITHMTGGLQFQVGDWWKDLKDFSDQEELFRVSKKKWKDKSCSWWGVPVWPASRSCTGSQPIPYIYDDRPSHEDVVAALVKLYEMGRDERRVLGLKAREWAMTNFNMTKMIQDWDMIIEKTMAEHKKPTYVMKTL